MITGWRVCVAAGPLFAALLAASACGGATPGGSGTAGRNDGTPVEVPLEAVALPDLSQVSDSVREQIEARWRPVDGLQTGAMAPAATAAETYGALGMVLMAAEFPNAAMPAFRNAPGARAVRCPLALLLGSPAPGRRGARRRGRPVRGGAGSAAGRHGHPRLAGRRAPRAGRRGGGRAAVPAGVVALSGFALRAVRAGPGGVDARGVRAGRAGAGGNPGAGALRDRGALSARAGVPATRAVRSGSAAPAAARGGRYPPGRSADGRARPAARERSGVRDARHRGAQPRRLGRRGRRVQARPGDRRRRGAAAPARDGALPARRQRPGAGGVRAGRRGGAGPAPGALQPGGAAARGGPARAGGRAVRRGAAGAVVVPGGAPAVGLQSAPVGRSGRRAGAVSAGVADEPGPRRGSLRARHDACCTPPLGSRPRPARAGAGGVPGRCGRGARTRASAGRGAGPARPRWCAGAGHGGSSRLAGGGTSTWGRPWRWPWPRSALSTAR